jgi:hypothetical protein
VKYALNENQQDDIKTRCFPPPSHGGFGFVEKRIYTPNRADKTLSGARRAHFKFEDFLHHVTPGGKVSWMKVKF